MELYYYTVIASLTVVIFSTMFFDLEYKISERYDISIKEATLFLIFVSWLPGANILLILSLYYFFIRNR